MIIDIEAKEIPENTKTENFLGTHLICELYDCDKHSLDDIGLISIAIEEAAKKSEATILEKSFHKFSPQGVSGVIIIAESHISIHTWPEYGYAAVDFFTCSETCNVDIITNYLSKIFKSKRKASVLKIMRGKL